VIGAFALLHALVVLALIAAVPLGAYALLGWMSSPVDPPRWGKITRGQRLLIGRRLYQQERRLAKALSVHVPSPDGGAVRWWWQRSFTSALDEDSLPQIVTWFLVGQAVEDLDELRRVAVDSPLGQWR